MVIKKVKLSVFDEKLRTALQDYKVNDVKRDFSNEELDKYIAMGLMDMELFLTSDDFTKEEYLRIKKIISYDEDKIYTLKEIVKLLLVMNVLIRDEFKYFANLLFEENYEKFNGKKIEKKEQSFGKIFTRDMKEKYSGNIDLAVFNAISTINEIHENVRFSKLENIGYMDIEKEIRRIGVIIEEHPDMYEIFHQVKFMLEVFTKTEILRERELNAKKRKSSDQWLRIDCTTSNDFDSIMKRILMLQALIGVKIKPQFSGIVDAIFEDCKNIVAEAINEDISVLASPVKFYNKGVERCTHKN